MLDEVDLLVEIGGIITIIILFTMQIILSCTYLLPDQISLMKQHYAMTKPIDFYFEIIVILIQVIFLLIITVASSITLVNSLVKIYKQVTTFKNKL